MSDDPGVRGHLAAARAAHQRYRDALPHRAPGDATGPIRPGDHAAARDALHDALQARAAAIALDPLRNDPAWQDEAPTFDHDALVTFYRAQLDRP